MYFMADLMENGYPDTPAVRWGGGTYAMLTF